MKDNLLLQSVMKGVVVGLLASFIYKMFIKMVTNYFRGAGRRRFSGVGYL